MGEKDFAYPKKCVTDLTNDLIKGEYGLIREGFND
jgi:hypothetical protein